MTPIGRGYRTLRLMRTGGSVDVFDAWSDERGCRCVVKLMKKSREGRSKARAQLRLEAELLLSLSHPHIVRAYEYFETPRVALVLETITGETLSHMLRSTRRRLAARDVAVLGLQLCSAIRYLHAKGYLHLDLKPSNVIVQAGLARLIDLGIAAKPGRGVAGIGTDLYMAPEQARGDVLTTATDVFSLGAVLYEAATGKRAFQSDAKRGHFDQLVRRADLVAAHRKLPDGMSAMIDRCLTPEAEKRPSIDALIRELKRVAGD